jgi:hypothetical protein
MKFLLVLVVVVGGLWLLLRKRGDDAPPAPPAPRSGPTTGKPAEMVACARCDLRLPRAEALLDAQGRAYCDEAHRRAGPR